MLGGISRRLNDFSGSVLGGNHQLVQDLLEEAKASWQKAREEQVSIYASDARNEWRLITSRPKRPLNSIILDAGVKEGILEDARDFLDSKEWYSDRGIPFRRGYLLVSHLPHLGITHTQLTSISSVSPSMEHPDPERRL